MLESPANAKKTSEMLYSSTRQTVSEMACSSLHKALLCKQALAQLVLANATDIVSENLWEVNSRLTLEAFNGMAIAARPLVVLVHNLAGESLHRLEFETETLSAFLLTAQWTM